MKFRSKKKSESTMEEWFAEAVDMASKVGISPSLPRQK